MSIPSFFWSLASEPIAFEFTATAPLSADSRNGEQVRDLLLNASHDLVLVNGDLAVVAGIDSIRQDSENRMRFFRGEWFLDLLAGVPYFQSVLVKSPNLESIRDVFYQEIVGTLGVAEVKDLKLDYSPGARTLRVNWTAVSDLNELVSAQTEIEVR